MLDFVHNDNRSQTLILEPEEESFDNFEWTQWGTGFANFPGFQALMFVRVVTMSTIHTHSRLYSRTQAFLLYLQLAFCIYVVLSSTVNSMTSVSITVVYLSTQVLCSCQ